METGLYAMERICLAVVLYSSIRMAGPKPLSILPVEQMVQREAAVFVEVVEVERIPSLSIHEEQLRHPLAD